MPPSSDESRLSANVVDIRRFSTHDGHGIRTTIFLKGCSLECAWCQNPETINPRRNPVFFRSRCIDCGLCVRAATHGEARQNEAGETFVDTTVSDADWENLTSLCPTGAIRFDSRRYTVAELVGVAQRDRVFFGEGGGVTLSGGEPLFLPHFASAFLKALKEAGMNTAIETALNVRPEFLAEALPYADHVFADCKLIDDAAHRRYVGAPNERILANLATLLTGERRADVTVRTPLIPGVTDGEDNIAGIASFISGLYPDVRYELLNYNPLASAKYDVLPGREFLFAPEENPPLFSKAQMAGFRDLARANGVWNLIVE
jgi:pyruvate formate lyase activating enzyme